MKHFIAGLLVMSALLLLGFQKKPPLKKKTTYTYKMTQQHFNPKEVKKLEKDHTDYINATSKKYGRLKHVTLTFGHNQLGGGHIYQFLWEKEN